MPERRPAKAGGNPGISGMMEPLRVVAGGRQTAAAAATRLRAHRATAAPVVTRGRVAGVVTLGHLEDAIRHGLGGATLSDLVSGGAPRVAAAARAASIERVAAGGTAPAVLVESSPGGPLLGLVPRHHVYGSSALLDAPPRGTDDLRARMSRLLGPERLEILRRAGALADSRRAGLYLAGGVVRDLLLGIASQDLDLVVEGDGGGYAEQLGRALGARVTRHEAFGTAVLELPDGDRLDVATARKESYAAPAKLPRVQAGGMPDDLWRRDVTLNAMAVRLDGSRFGHLIDLAGGRADLRDGRLRVHHMLSLTEDPTRAFRIARFAARLGFRPTSETVRSLQLARRAKAFEALSGQRLFRELAWIVDEPRPVAALAWCARLDLLGAVGPGLRWDTAAAAWVARLPEGGERLLRALLMLMLLSVRARRSERAALAARLGITGRAAGALRDAPAAAQRLSRALAVASRPSVIVDLCESASTEALALASAIGASETRRALRAFDRLRTLRPSVTGGTLREMGLSQGPAFTRILEALRRARLDGRVTGEAAERKMAERLVAAASRRH